MPTSMEGHNANPAPLSSYSGPAPENYKIGIIINPCKGKGRTPDCCMNVFGTPEYGLLLVPDLTYPFRVVPKYDLGSDTEILDNVQLVDEFRSPLSTSNMCVRATGGRHGRGDD
jgi:hypothetical protein